MDWLSRYAPSRRDLIAAGAFALLWFAGLQVALAMSWYPGTTINWYYLAGYFGTAVLLTRNRYPLSTLLVVSAIYPALYGVGLLTELHLLPILLAAYAVAACGQVRTILTVVVAEIGVTALYMSPLEWWSIAQHPSTFSQRLWEADFSRMSVAQAATVAVILLGRAAYQQRRSTAQLLARHQEIERLRKVETDQLVTAERTRIARELHDVVAHHISAVVIRAQAADRVAGDRPEETRDAVRWIAASGQETLAAMRHVVRVLRSTESGATLTPQATLAELTPMTERLRAVGLDVELRVPAVTPVLPSAVELAAVRIVQEALTNVLVHARATRAVVEVRLAVDQLLLDIHDDGAAGAPPTQPIEVITARTRAARPAGPVLEAASAQATAVASARATADQIVTGQTLGGNGLIGMRERATSCGGYLTIRTSVLGGWQISAMLRPTMSGLTPVPGKHPPPSFSARSAQPAGISSGPPPADGLVVQIPAGLTAASSTGLTAAASAGLTSTTTGLTAAAYAAYATSDPTVPVPPPAAEPAIAAPAGPAGHACVEVSAVCDAAPDAAETARVEPVTVDAG